MSRATTDTAANPFALMLDPERVIDAMARSDQLRHLKLRRLRPLDRPWIPFAQPSERLALEADEADGAGLAAAHRQNRRT